MMKNHREVVNIARQASIRKDLHTDEISIDKDQYRCYLDGMKMMIQLMKVKPSECMFYNDGKMLNTKAMSKGVVAQNFKPIVELLNKGNRR